MPFWGTVEEYGDVRLSRDESILTTCVDVMSYESTLRQRGRVRGGLQSPALQALTRAFCALPFTKASLVTVCLSTNVSLFSAPSCVWLTVIFRSISVSAERETALVMWSDAVLKSTFKEKTWELLDGNISKPTLAKPTLAKPTLAKVKVFVCKDFGFWKLIVWVFFVCVEWSWVGGEGGAPWTQIKWGPEGWEAQNFALFFPSPAAIFILLSLSWGSSRGILVVFEAPGRSNVHVWNSRAVVKPRRPRSLHTTHFTLRTTHYTLHCTLHTASCTLHTTQQQTTHNNTQTQVEGLAKESRFGQSRPSKCFPLAKVQRQRSRGSTTLLSRIMKLLPMSCYQWHKWFCAHDQGNDGVFIHAESSSVCFIRVKVPARKLFFPAKSQKDASGIDDTSLFFDDA